MAPRPDRSTAIHEAGHAAMAYLLGVRFTEISVVEDDDRLGHVQHRRPAEWSRSLIERRIMVLLAGPEAERAWYARQPDAPDGWEDRVSIGAGEDYRTAVHLGGYVCGGSVRLSPGISDVATPPARPGRLARPPPWRLPRGLP